MEDSIQHRSSINPASLQHRYSIATATIQHSLSTFARPRGAWISSPTQGSCHGFRIVFRNLNDDDDDDDADDDDDDNLVLLQNSSPMASIQLVSSFDLNKDLAQIPLAAPFYRVRSVNSHLLWSKLPNGKIPGKSHWPAAVKQRTRPLPSVHWTRTSRGKSRSRSVLSVELMRDCIDCLHNGAASVIPGD